MSFGPGRPRGSRRRDGGPSGGSRPLWRPSASIAHRAAAGALLLLLSSCLVDGDRCGPNQGRNALGLCVCDEGAGIDEDGRCAPCPEPEVVVAGSCVCPMGMVRPAGGGPCEPLPPALGAPCSPTEPCTDMTFDHCQTDPFGDYCTETGCAVDEDCLPTYECETSADPTYCRRPPIGQGQECTTDADCEGTEATFCEFVFSNVCLVEECLADPEVCGRDTICCDLTEDFGISLCVPEAACAP